MRVRHIQHRFNNWANRMCRKIGCVWEREESRMISAFFFVCRVDWTSDEDEEDFRESTFEEKCEG